METRGCFRAARPAAAPRRLWKTVRPLVILPMLAGLCGCPVTQPQDTPVPAVHLEEENTGTGYWLYVPSSYSSQRDWPLVVTLHGTHGWDRASAQIDEWKHLAEEKGFLVAAPELKSPQGILPVIKGLWFDDLQRDERAVLAVMDAIAGKYRVDTESVLLTGFSAGGYPLYYIGLRNPKRFNMLMARACNSDIDVFENLQLTDRARQVPIMIFWGKDDLRPIQEQSWQAFRYLRERHFKLAEQKEIRGGHLRRPELAYDLWKKHLPERHRR